MTPRRSDQEPYSPSAPPGDKLTAPVIPDRRPVGPGSRRPAGGSSNFGTGKTHDDFIKNAMTLRLDGSKSKVKPPRKPKASEMESGEVTSATLQLKKLLHSDPSRDGLMVID